MKKNIYNLLTVFFLLGAAVLPQKAVTVVSLRDYQTRAIKNNDTLYVVNFWATWCKPCVQELPFFEAEQAKLKGQKVKFIYVSMNSPKEVAQVNSFINQNQYKADVLLLNAGNPNIWIDQIDSSWSGAIPATIMYKGGKTALFYEGEFTRNKLDSVIQKQIL